MIGTSGTQDTSVEDHGMTAPEAFVGLCLTCNNSGTCVYRKRRGTDAIYCELYDGYAIPQNGHGLKMTSAIIDGSQETGISGTKGLCVNCAHRDSCQLAKPESGVWHCEEYE